MGPSRRVCPACGATNIGSHEACLLCQAMLPPLVEPTKAGVCPQCGEAVPSGGKFCEHCGASLASEPTKVALFCTQCGQEAAPGQKFCPNCGAALPRTLQ